MANPIPFKVTFVGRIPASLDNGNWEHFAWLVNIGTETFPYRTGIGHSTSKRNRYGDWRSMTPPKNKKVISCNDYWIHVPRKRDILYALFIDASYGEMSFRYFCEELGYNHDSIKDLDTYRACEGISEKLKRVFKNKYKDYSDRISRWNN